jgi:hypothetical protein
VYTLSSGNCQFLENLIGGSHTSLNGADEFIGAFSVFIYRLDRRFMPSKYYDFRQGNHTLMKGVNLDFLYSLSTLIKFGTGDDFKNFLTMSFVKIGLIKAIL